MSDHFIGEEDFKVFLPDIAFAKSEGDEYNSRQIAGVMSTQNTDRQDETVLAKGLDFSDFMSNGHFNDNHSQQTSAIVGYPENVQFYDSLKSVRSDLEASGWVCKGYILKGTKRADEIWELAKALKDVPNKKLGFSIEGKVTRRANKTIEKARIRNIAITNCPVNTDATWNVLAKSFSDGDFAVKALAAGAATSPATQSGGGALRAEDLDADIVENWRKNEKKKKEKKYEKALMNAIGFDSLVKAMDYAIRMRPDFTDEAAAEFAKQLFLNERYL